MKAKVTVKSTLIAKRVRKEEYFASYCLKFNGHTFRVVFNNRNGHPCGFDTNHCLQMLTENGWSNLADTRELVPEGVNTSYYIREDEADMEARKLVDGAKNYIKLVFGE